MSSASVVTVATIVLGGVLALTASMRQTPPAPASQTPARGEPAPPEAGAPDGPARGRAGGGRGGPGATLYAENCAGCHGTDLSGGRTRSLFDEKWLSGMTDEKLVSAIQQGVPNTEMMPFKQVLNDLQMWQVVQYIRTQAGNLAPRPAFVADPAGLPLKTARLNVNVEVVTKGLETPWSLAFLPDGRMLITERAGRLRILNKGTLSEPVKGTPKVHEQQDGGMFDVEVHPQYAKNGWIYLAFSEVRPGFEAPPPAAAPPAAQQAPGRGRGPAIPSMTVVVRGKVSNDLQWTDEQVIFRGPPELYTPSGSHFGSRLIFDRAGHLFYTIGERGAMQDAQDLTKPTGKIHRVNDDGTVPKDNPFVSQPGSVPTIWSYGHRNPEGLAWDPATGLLWESEHGPTGGDEINVIERGHNYGWSVATKGTQNGVNKTSEPGMDDPIVYYTPTLAPAGITFYTGDRYPAWKNTSLFVTGLAGQQLRRLEIKGRQVVDQEVVFNQLGRVRDIVQGPDGYLYVALQNPTGAGTGFGLAASTPGMIIRLMPAKAEGPASAGPGGLKPAPPNTAKKP
jgi:aldose sugar dehydrogenase